MPAQYSFTLILAPVPEMTDDLAEALFEAGCDDGSIGESEGITRIYFHREAPSLSEAIASAIKNVTAAGCRVIRLEMTAEELAQVEGIGAA